MRTKEEILDEHLVKNKIFSDRKADYIDDYGVHEVIEDAMDEYAKEIAIAFAIEYAKGVLTWDNCKNPEDVADDRMDVRYRMFLAEQQEKSSLK
jgi:hypothetical protein